jgi:hypothetical protein
MRTCTKRYVDKLLHLSCRASLQHGTIKHQAKRFFYASGWKKFEQVWDVLIRARQLRWMTPLLEGVLSRVTGEKMKQPRGVEPSELTLISRENTI